MGANLVDDNLHSEAWTISPKTVGYDPPGLLSSLTATLTQGRRAEEETMED